MTDLHPVGSQRHPVDASQRVLFLEFAVDVQLGARSEQYGLAIAHHHFAGDPRTAVPRHLAPRAGPAAALVVIAAHRLDPPLRDGGLAAAHLPRLTFAVGRVEPLDRDPNRLGSGADAVIKLPGDGIPGIAG